MFHVIKLFAVSFFIIVALQFSKGEYVTFKGKKSLLEYFNVCRTDVNMQIYTRNLLIVKKSKMSFLVSLVTAEKLGE